MKVDCASARKWLAAAPGRAEILPRDSAPHAAHFARCEACNELLRRYQAFVSACEQTCAHEPTPDAGERFIAEAATLARGTAPYPELVAEARVGLEHEPSGSAEATFLKAAREQHEDGTASGGRRSPRWKPLFAAAAAACVMAAVWIASSLVQSPESAGPQPGDPANTHRAHGQATIVSQSGTVSIDGARLSPGQRSARGAGAVIATGRASHVQLQDLSRASITFGQETRGKIRSWSAGRTSLLLRSGTIRARVQRRRAGELFEILTPSARVMVVGTVFAVTYSAPEGTVVNCTSGKVRVERRDGSLAGYATAGRTVRVAPARQAAAATAAPPSRGAGITQPAFRVTASPAPGPGAARPSADAAAAARQVWRGAESPEDRTVAAPALKVEHSGTPPAPAAIPSAPAASAGAAAAERSPQVPPVAASSPEATPTAPSAGPSPLLRARALLGQGQDRQALALLLAAPAGDWRRDALLGDAYQLVGRYRLAQKAYRAALTRTIMPPAPRSSGPADPCGNSCSAPILADLATLQGTRFKDTSGAAKTWGQYLESYPVGPAATSAHLALARLALKDGRSKTAQKHLRAAYRHSPDTSQGTSALALLGAQLIKERRWPEAEALFAQHGKKGRARRGEVSLVGLIRVRIAQGKAGAARSLILQYRRRFPRGSRANEVRRLENALGGL